MLSLMAMAGCRGKASVGPELLLPWCHWFSEVAFAMAGSVGLPCRLKMPHFDG